MYTLVADLATGLYKSTAILWVFLPSASYTAHRSVTNGLSISRFEVSYIVNIPSRPSRTTGFSAYNLAENPADPSFTVFPLLTSKSD